MFKSSWKSWLTAGAVFFAAAAQAAPVTVSVVGSGPFSAGDTLTVRLIDANPTGMYSSLYGAYAADLRVTFDTALIQAPLLASFLPGVADPAGDPEPLIGAVTALTGTLAYIDINFFLVDLDATRLTATPTELLSLSFTVQPGAGGQGSITVAPYAPTDGEPFLYEFPQDTSPPFTVAEANTVPEPASLALMALGLGAGGWATRRRTGRQAGTRAA